MTFLTRALSTTALITLLAACQPIDPYSPNAFDSMRGMRGDVNERLHSAGDQMLQDGNYTEARAFFEKLYANKKSNPHIAIKYAESLRKTDQPHRALAVLAPFVERKNTIPDVLVEYAASCIETGNLPRAEELLNRVVENSRAKTLHPQAYNLLGITVDAKGNHTEAEHMYRLALEDWDGDPSSVMNNLALSLTNQGKLDEALSILRQALVIAPDKQEIARNIQIISDLRDSITPKP